MSMGDYADGILDGLVCEDCGEFIDGDAPGFPRLCDACQQGTRRTSSKKKRRTHQADLDFQHAKQILTHADCKLIRHTKYHFQIRHDGAPFWLIEVYPSNLRIYRQKRFYNIAPHLRLPSEWTLLDVARATARAVHREAHHAKSRG